MATILEGDVRRAGATVRINVQLIDTDTDEHLWAETYDRELTAENIFEIQADIAQQIATALEAELLPSERESIQRQATNSTEAYGFYLRAMAIWNNSDLVIGTPALRAGIESALDQAIEIDSEYALAYAQRARLYAIVLNADVGTQENYVTRRAELEALALSDLDTALALDSSLGAAYGTLGRIHQYNWRGAEAEEAYERALELSPNNIDVLSDYGNLIAYLGRQEEALRLTRRAVDLDPSNGERYGNLAIANWIAGDLDAAAAASRRAIELAPTDPGAPLDLASVEATRGNRTVVLAELPISEQLLGGNTNPHFLALIAYAYGRVNQRDEAERLLRLIEQTSADQRIAPAAWALLYLAIDDQQQALYWLEEAADDPQPYEGHFSLQRLKANVWQDPVLDQPEFVEVRSRLGFRE